MKRLIMCEGPNELTLINILLENDALAFSEDDLLGLTAYHARQIKTNVSMGFKDMSPGMKELYKLLLEGKIIHGGNPVLRWMAGNVVAEIDAAENIKPSKKKSTEKIDGIVAWIMGLDRAIRHEQQGSVYDDPEHGLWVF
ncbi:MAG: hypothetical protein IJ899_05150 [Blautia sp.]|nr:hypothetical protein [Blautia sp.]